MPQGYQRMLSGRGLSPMMALPRTATPGSLYGGSPRLSPGFSSANSQQQYRPTMYVSQMPEPAPTPIETFTPMRPEPQLNDSFELIESEPTYPTVPRAPSRKRRENLTITVDKKIVPDVSLLNERTPVGSMQQNVSTSNLSGWVEQCKVSIKTNPLLMLFLILVVFILFDFWSITIQRFLRDKFNAGKDLSWKAMLLLSIISTVAVFLIIWAIGIPFTQFESVV